MIQQVSEETAAATGGIIGLVISLGVGALIGWIASILMKTNAQMGAVANVLVGIAGSWLGGVLFRMLGLPQTTFFGLVAAIAGASLLIAILRVLRILK